MYMKTQFFFNMVGVLLGMRCLLGVSESISMTASNPDGVSSFNTSANWATPAVPAPGNDYFTAGFVMRTPVTASSHVFLGDSLTINGGTLAYKTTGNQTITVNDLRINGGTIGMWNAGTMTLAGGVLLQAGGAIFDGDRSGRTLQVNSIISGSGGLTVTSIADVGGRVVLTGSSDFTGTTTVNRGVLRVSNNSALGSVSAGTIVNGNDSTTSTILELSGGITLAEPLFLNGTSLGRVSVNNAGGSNILSGPISITIPSGGQLVQFGANSGTMTIQGDITGSSVPGVVVFFRGNGTGLVTGDINMTSTTPVAKTDDGTWTIGSAGGVYNFSSFANARGTTRMGAADVLPATSTLSVGQADNALARFDLNGYNQTVSGLGFNLGSGGIKEITNESGSATLTVNIAGTSTYGARFAGTTFTLLKTGAGTLSLSGDNIHGGATVIEQGMLSLIRASSINNLALSSVIDVRDGAVLNVTGLQGGTLTVADGQTLTGSGMVMGGLIIGGGATISPGASPGTLSTGEQIWAEQGSYVFEFDAVDPFTLHQDALKGSNDGHDWLELAGALSITSSTLNPFMVRVRGLQLDDSPGGVDGWNPTGSYRWTMATAALGVLGFDPASIEIDTTGFTSHNSIAPDHHFFVSADTDNVYLNYGAIPEPGSLAFFVVGGLALFVFRRQKR